MASRRAERRRACERKKRYERDEAVKVMVQLRRKGEPHMNAYHCRYCGGWHVGHLPKKLRIIRSQQKER